MDMSWLRNESAKGAEIPEESKGKVMEEDDDSSSEWSSEKDEADILPKKHMSRKKKSRKRKNKHQSKEKKRKKRMLNDREKIRRIEEELTNREKHKRTRKLKLYYWGDDFDVDVDVRKKTTVWADDKKERKSFVDRIGNNDNLLYEQLYRLDVPNYHQIYDFFLGGEKFPGYLKRMILKDKGAGEVHNELRQSANHRYFAHKHHLRDRDRSLRRIYINAADQKSHADSSYPDDYLPLEQEEGRVEWKDSGLTFEERQLERTRDFSASLRKDPHNIQLWFDFIRFQDESTMEHRANKAAPVLEKKLSVFEKAIEENPGSVPLILGYLDTCRRHMTPDEVSEKWKLIIAKHPSSSRLWKEYLLHHQSEFETFSIASSSELYREAVEKLSDVRNQAEAEGKARSVSPKDNKELNELEEALVSICIRNAVLQKQAGYTEKAVALLQALLEFNLFCPPQLSGSEEEKMQFFQGFWDSDCPRVGDPGAPTWQGWYDQQLKIHRGELNEEDIVYPTEHKGGQHEEDSKMKQQSSFSPSAAFSPDPILSWIRKERLTGEQHWQPLRNIEEELGEEDDDGGDVDEAAMLQRVVLIDDIRPFLCTVSNKGLLADVACHLLIQLGVSKRVIGGRYRLSSYKFSVMRDQELEFFEQVPGLDGSQVTSMDYFELSSSIVPQARPTAASAAAAAHGGGGGKTGAGETKGTMSGEEKAPTPPAAPLLLPERPPEGIDLLKGVEAADATNDHRQQILEPRKQFCRRLFQALTSGPYAKSISMRCSYMAFEAQYGYAKAEEVGKGFLKADQMNLRLWNAYAQLQKLYSKYKEGCRIYKKALIMAPELSKKCQRDAPLLFWSFAEIQLFDLRKPAAAARIVVEAPFFKFEKASFKKLKKPVKPTAFIKAQKAFLKLIGDPPSSRPTILQSKWDNTDYDPRTYNIWSVAVSKSEERSHRYIEVSPGASLAVCFAWMEYFRGGLEEGMAVFKQHVFSRVVVAHQEVKNGRGGRAGPPPLNTNIIVKGSFQHEWLEMACVRMIRFHEVMNPTPPRVLRDALSSALTSFPTNAYLLNTFIRREGEQGHMTTRLRRHFDSALDDKGGAKEISPILWLYAIVWELPRPGARHRIINLFEKALRGNSRCTVAIWRLYMRYLLHIGHLDSAKSAYYRAFHQCAWSKTLWLDGLCLLQNMANREEDALLLTEKEFKDIVNLMVEKELRNHVALQGDRDEKQDI